MQQSQALKGHAAALACVLMWGTTFIATKVLLVSFSPAEILFYRFVLGYLALLAACPRLLRGTTLRQECLMAGAGLCGVTLYFLMENIALTYTTASNVGVLVSVAPFLTMLLAHWFAKEEKPGPWFFVGFASAILGIFLISYNGATALHLNPLGDFLAIGAAAVWAVYSILVKKIGQSGLGSLLVTRRIFLYGLFFMIPAFFLLPFRLNPARFLQLENLFTMLFLGLGASALCFAMWNWALHTLGAVKASVYIYLVPVVTVVTSVLVLGERVTLLSALGTALALLGLVLSERGKLRVKTPAES